MQWLITSEGGFLKFKDSQHIFYVPKQEIKRVSLIRGDTVKLEASHPSRDLYLRLTDFAPGIANNQTELAAWLTELIGEGSGNAVELSEIKTAVGQLKDEIKILQAGNREILLRLIHSQPYRIDEANPNEVYKGYLLNPGYNEEQDVWAISLTTNFGDSVNRILWAEGSHDFTFQWAMRRHYEYK
jgi:hypothetical protein